MELLFSNEALLVGALMVLILVLGTINVFIYEDTPASIVIFAGLCLIAIAGGALYYLDIMSTVADKVFKRGDLSKETYDNFKRSSHIFLYLFPFVSAAIGTNLISDAITKNLHYKNKLTLGSVLYFLWEFPKILFSLIIVIPLVGVIVPPLMMFSGIRKRKHLMFNFINKISRFAYLKLLHLDIFLRNFQFNKLFKRNK